MSEARFLVRLFLQAIAAKADDGQPCCEWMGPSGACHFVKMIHKGIEYADMQMICEIYALMKGLGMTAEQKGTGKWTSQIALDWGVSAPTVTDAVFARTMSAVQSERVIASKLLKGPKTQAVQNLETVLPKIEKAFWDAKI